MPTDLRTPFCDLVGITAPVVQAPIGGPSVPALAAAVSEAGGLGTLAASWDDPDALRRRIRHIAALTSAPFAVNLILDRPQEERLSACLEEGVRIISTFWGDPAPLTARIHRAGALHLHTVSSAREAREAVDAGVDAVVAQGWEAGGHLWGRTATLPLVPAVVDAVAPVPVVAAGGIADGRGLAAALALGAGAAWIGTRFLLSEEAATADAYRQALIEARETDTVEGILFDKGWHAPHRALRNSTAQAWELAGRPLPGQERPGEADVLGHLPDGTPVERYADVAPTRGTTGQAEAMALYAGQSVGLVGRTEPAGEIVRTLVDEAAGALRRFS